MGGYKDSQQKISPCINESGTNNNNNSVGNNASKTKKCIGGHKKVLNQENAPTHN